MAYSDFFTNFHLFMRWLHVIAGITWIGHLYFFNFVNTQLQANLDDATKKLVNPQLMPRALWWFRWGAMVTFLAGLVLFTMIYMYAPGSGFGPTSSFLDEGHMSQRAAWILTGMTFGTIMWFNVWFIIWPTQKALLSGQVPADQVAGARAKAGKFSRINTWLSGPMLFGMLAPAHYGSLNCVTWVVFVALGFGGVWAALFHVPKVGKTV